jgi:glutathione S-transferase
LITLYDYELSATSYAVRLLLAVLQLPHERIEIDVHPGREHESAWFLELNPLGQLPVIDDGGFILRDVHSILIYLAEQYDPADRWCPREDAATLATIRAWLAFAGRLSGTAGAARLHDTMLGDGEIDVEKSRKAGHALLRLLDEHLWFAEQDRQRWLCGAEHPTIADIACFPHVMLCEEGGISRLPYPSVRRWTDRVKRIPHFLPMSGIFGAAPERDGSVP